MILKLQITKFLIVFGLLLNIGSYGVELFNFYTSEDLMSIGFEETDSSEQKEKEGSEKEEFKEKDKISQDKNDKIAALADIIYAIYPDFYCKNSSVYLEQKTPPPQYS